MAEHVLEDMLNVLCDIFLSRTHKTGSWYLLGVKNISSYTHKTGSGYLLPGGEKHFKPRPQNRILEDSFQKF